MQTSFKLTGLVAALLSASTVSAAALSTCAQGASDVCYAVGVPTNTASSNTGNMYFQLSAPTSYSWVALGMGTSMMSGANMFIMYTDGAGNVTVSSRVGSGHVQPQYSASNAETLTLLSGSGVSDGKMIANFVCKDCKSWNGGQISTTSNSVNMIGAWKQGTALASKDPAATIAMHDSHSTFNADLTQATIQTDSNPFTNAATSPTSGGVTNVARPNGKIIWAHGIGMALVFGVLYPFGSALMPMLGKWQLHAGIQCVSWLAMWAFFGLGVYGAQVRSLLFNNTHTTFGTVVVCLLAIQPALGQLHHMHFVKNGARGIVSYVHIWWGRILLVLGLINGGLGLQLSRSKQRFVIAYAVVSALFYVFWIAVKVYATMRDRKAGGRLFRKASSMNSRSNSDGDELPMDARYGAHDHGKQ